MPKRSRTPRWAVFTVAALSGCAPSIALPPAKIAVPPAYERVADEGGAASLDRWWIGFEDKQLTELVDRALANGFDSRLAFARLLEARAVRSRAIRDTEPTGNVSANFSRAYTNQLSSNVPNIDLGLLTPLLAAYFLKPHAYVEAVRPFTGPYRRILDWMLDHR